MTIISHAYNFIFIKTTKTAGTSIEVDLAAVLEPDAIVTPILPTVERHRPRNWQTTSGEAAFHNHMTATDIRSRLGAEKFERMHKFCVEREPASKCISQFHMMRNSSLHNPGGQYRASWADYCAAGRFPIDLGKYTERRENGDLAILADTILAYETLEYSLPQLLSNLGLKDFKLTSRLKSEYSVNRIVHPDEVTPYQRQRIYSAFSRTLEITGLYRS